MLFLGAFFARVAFAVTFGPGAVGAVCTVEDVDDDAGAPAGVALGGGRLLTVTCKPCALHLSSFAIISPTLSDFGRSAFAASFFGLIGSP